MAKLARHILEQIVALRGKGVSRNEVARRLGVARDTVTRYEAGAEGFASHAVDPEQRPPAEDVMARLAEIPPDTRPIGAMLLGDPLPGRSALDRRQARRVGQLPATRSMQWNMRGGHGA